MLEPLDLAGAVVTADALHAQREHAQFLVTEKNAHYILAVKNNQPTLYAQLTSLPWRQVPAGFDAREKGHGRAEWRTLKVTAVATGIAFPHATRGHPDQAPPKAADRDETMVHRNQLRRHQPARQPSHPCPARPMGTRPLEHRELLSRLHL